MRRNFIYGILLLVFGAAMINACVENEIFSFMQAGIFFALFLILLLWNDT